MLISVSALADVLSDVLWK